MGIYILLYIKIIYSFKCAKMCATSDSATPGYLYIYIYIYMCEITKMRTRA